MKFKEIMGYVLRKEVVVPILSVLVLLIVYKLGKKLIKKIFTIKTKRINPKKQKTLMSFFINILRLLLFIIGALIILETYGIDTNVIVTSLGAVTVVVGLAFQDILKDFIAGISLIFENSYNIGDCVTLNGFKGEVVYMGMKATKIKSSDGNTLIINNGQIQEIINHTIANSLAIVDVGVSYEVDLDKVETVLNKMAKKLQNKIPELKGEIKVLGIENFDSSSIIYRITAEVEAGTQYSVQRQLRKNIKLEFDKEKIEIPYNKLVISNE